MKSYLIYLLIFIYSFEAIATPDNFSTTIVNQIISIKYDNPQSNYERVLFQNFSKISESDFLKILNKHEQFQKKSLEESLDWVLENTDLKFNNSTKEKYLDFYKSLLFFLRSAQNGYYLVSKQQQTKVTNSLYQLMQLIEADSKLNSEQKSEALNVFINGAIEWAVNQIQIINNVEAARVNYASANLLTSWITLSSPEAREGVSSIKVASWSAYSALIFIVGALTGLGPIITAGTFDYPSMDVATTILDYAWKGGLVLIGLNTLYWWKKDLSNKQVKVRASIQNFKSFFKSKPSSNFPFPYNSPIIKQNYDLTLENRSIFNSNELEVLLTKPIPDLFGVEELFKYLRSNKASEELAMLENSLHGNGTIPILITAGKQFREQYIKMLFEDFNSDLSILDPEQDLLSRINAHPKIVIKQGSSENQYIEAERMAWHDVKLKFSLNENDSLEKLKKQFSNSINYEWVENFYQSRLLFHLNREEIRNLPSTRSISEIKFNESKRLLQLRITNLKAALIRSSKIKDSKIVFKALNNEFRISKSELANAEINFIENLSSVSTKDIYMVQNRNGFFYGLFTGFYDIFAVRSEYDKPEMKEFYRTEVHMPQNPSRYVQIKTNTKSILISEVEYNKLHLLLVPHFESNTDNPNSNTNRYLLESQRRDTNLSNLIFLLESAQDKDELALKQRIQKHIDGRATSIIAPKSITESIQIYSEYSSNRISDIDYIRWSGYAIHPYYWTARDQAAIVEKKNSIFKSSENYLNIQPFSLDKHSITEKNLKKHRERSKVNKFIRAVTLITALSATVYNFPNIAGVMHDYSTGSRSIGDVGKTVLSSKMDFSNQIVGKNESRQFGEDKEDLVQITYVKQGIVVPKYFNSTHASNFSSDPADQTKEELDTIGDSSNKLNRISVSNNTNDTSNADIKIKSIVPTYSDDGRFPILSPSGYKLVALKIKNDARGDYVDSEDITTFQFKRFGTYYARSFDYRLKRITYEASFVKDQSKSTLTKEFQSLNKDILKSLLPELRDSGATELANEISNLVEKEGKISIYQFEETFSNSGIYTYQDIGMIKKTSNYFNQYFELNKQNSYNQYSQFLIDGRYFYQCTGSNNLFRDILNKYLTISGLPYEALPITGYVYKNNETKTITPPGHLHTLITHKSEPYQYFELDGTPVNTDPRDKEDETKEGREKEKELKSKDKEKKDNELSEAEEKSAIDKLFESLKFPTKKGEKTIHMISLRKKPELEDKHENNPLNERNLISSKELQEIRVLLAAELNKFNHKQSYKLNGLQLLQALPYLQKYAEGLVNSNYLLKILILVNSGIDLNNVSESSNQFANMEYKKLLTKHHGNITEAISNIASQIKSIYDKEYSTQIELSRSAAYSNRNYLLMGDVNLYMQKIFEIINSTQFEPKTLVRCEKIFY